MTKYWKCRVHRNQTGIDYKGAPIYVNSGVPSVPARAFMPGQEVILHNSQINVLNDAVIQQDIFIPRSSGIYQTIDPVRSAETRNPGIKFHRDPVTGVIRGKKETKCYIVEKLEPSSRKEFDAEMKGKPAKESPPQK